PTTIRAHKCQPNSLIDAPVGRWFNKLQLGFANPSNILGKGIVSAISHTKGLQTRWQTLAMDLTKETSKLNAKQQRALSSVLKEGEAAKTATGRGQTFTIGELKAKGLDEPTIKGYYQTRMMSDIMYDVANRQTRMQYQRQGIKDIRG